MNVKELKKEVQEWISDHEEKVGEFEIVDYIVKSSNKYKMVVIGDYLLPGIGDESFEVRGNSWDDIAEAIAIDLEGKWYECGSKEWK